MSEDLNQKWPPVDEQMQNALYNLYRLHGGNYTKMSKDALAPWRDRNRMAHYAQMYNFEQRWQADRAKELEERQLALKNSLDLGKIEAINKAMSLLQDEIPAKDIKTVWEIIKTELGEPTRINKNENNNHDDPRVQDTLDGIKELITKGQNEPRTDSKAIPSEGPASGDTAEV